MSKILTSLIFLFIGISLEAQIQLLKDVNMASASNKFSGPDNLVKVGGQLFFTAETAAFGTELWVSDGTQAGTHVVKDIMPGSSSSSPTNLVAFNGHLFFAAGDGISGINLWMTNGESDGTIVINRGAFSNPKKITIANNLLFFEASKELWRTDGTQVGTYRIKDILPGANAINAIGTYNTLTSSENQLFFTLNNGTNTELWISDGTIIGTKKLKDIPQGFPIRNPVSFGNSIIFSGYSNNFGYELWISDGTIAGTYQIKDVVPGSGSLPIRDLKVVKENLFFIVADVSGNSDLWKTNGTENGTQLVYDDIGNASGIIFTEMVSGADVIYIEIQTGANNVDIWKSDGTSAGTTLIKSFPTSAMYNDNIITFSNSTFFSLIENGGYNLYITDGTFDGTRLLSGTVFPVPMIEFNEELFFGRLNYSIWSGLWKVDKETEEVELVKDLNSGNLGSNSSEFVEHGDISLFFSNNGTNGMELWLTDGTTVGTTLVKDINSGSNSSIPHELTSWGDMKYFVATDATGQGIWKTDGTEEGTSNVFRYDAPGFLHNLLADENFLYFFESGRSILRISNEGTSFMSLPQSGTVTKSILKGGLVYYSISTLAGVSSLWRTDGDPENTIQLFNTSGFSILGMREYLGSVYFIVSQNSTYQLWKTDGDIASTLKVSDLELGVFNLVALSSIVLNDNLMYFIFNDRYKGIQLWRSDGSTVGTFKIKEILANNFDYQYNGLTSIGNVLFFRCDDGIHGPEPWRSDGTADGTYMIKDMSPGALGSYPSQFIQMGSNIYFTAADFSNGQSYEIWKTDGTACGTQNVTDQSSELAINSLYRLGEKFLVTAGSIELGSEPYIYDILSDPSILLCQSIEFPTIEDKQFDQNFFLLNAVSTSGLEVYFQSENFNKVKIEGNKVIFLAPGKVSITAFQDGNTSYNSAATVTHEFCINPSDPIVTRGDMTIDEIVLESSAEVGNQWLFNGNMINGANGKTYSIVSSGSGLYAVQVDIDGCLSNISDPFSYQITSVVSEDSEYFGLSPNPAVNFLNIRLSSSGLKEILIYRSDGKVIDSVSTIKEDVTLDITTYATGLYLLMIKDNSRTSIKRFIKK